MLPQGPPAAQAFRDRGMMGARARDGSLESRADERPHHVDTRNGTAAQLHPDRDPGGHGAGAGAGASSPDFRPSRTATSTSGTPRRSRSTSAWPGSSAERATSGSTTPIPPRRRSSTSTSIQEDIRWLGYDWGPHLYFASDYFEQLYQWAEELIRRGLAYVDDLSAEEIRQYRGTLTEPGRNSPYRDRPVEENLDLFRRMRAGEFPDGARVLRAKIDMASPNMNLRDPTLYRIRHVAHHRTGERWCIYPDVRLRAPPVGLDRAGHALPLLASSTRTTARSTTGSARRSGSTTRSRSSSRDSTSATRS